MSHTTKRVALIFSFTCATAFAAQEIAVDGSDITFPASVTLKVGGEDVNLRCTGTALREKAWINVYGIASYLAREAMVKNAHELAAADVPKALHLIMERKVGGKKMFSAFKEAILLNYKETEFTAELKQFQDYFTPRTLKTADHVWFIHVPGVGVSCKIANHEPMEIKNVKFSRAIWDIYLGKQNIGEHFVKGFTSRL